MHKDVKYLRKVVTQSISGSTTTAPLTTPLPTEPPEPPCCERVNGLCQWIEPECEALDEDDRKRFIWTEEFCDEIHPDDMAIIQERFQMYKDMLKRQKYARVSTMPELVFIVI